RKCDEPLGKIDFAGAIFSARYFGTPTKIAGALRNRGKSGDGTFGEAAVVDTPCPRSAIRESAGNARRHRNSAMPRQPTGSARPCASNAFSKHGENRHEKPRMAETGKLSDCHGRRRARSPFPGACKG